MDHRLKSPEKFLVEKRLVRQENVKNTFEKLFPTVSSRAGRYFYENEKSSLLLAGVKCSRS